MTRTIRFHPFSLFVGVGFALVGLVAMGQMPAGPHARFTPPSLAAIISPKNWIQIVEGSPFVVPAGRVFVPTALGWDEGANPPARARLYFDGVEMAAMTYRSDRMPMGPVAEGLAAGPGTVVSVEGLQANRVAQVWGFLKLSDASSIVYAPTPATTDWLVVQEGTPFVVPPGQLLVVTALGSPAVDQCRIRVDGVRVLDLQTQDFASFVSPSRVPVGLTVPAGGACCVDC